MSRIRWLQVSVTQCHGIGLNRVVLLSIWPSVICLNSLYRSLCFWWVLIPTFSAYYSSNMKSELTPRLSSVFSALFCALALTFSTKKRAYVSLTFYRVWWSARMRSIANWIEWKQVIVPWSHLQYLTCFSTIEFVPLSVYSSNTNVLWRASKLAAPVTIFLGPLVTDVYE
jgi:hypothetical protein